MLAEIDKDVRDIRILFAENEKLKTAVKTLREDVMTSLLDTKNTFAEDILRLKEVYKAMDRTREVTMKSETQVMAEHIRELREEVITLRGGLNYLKRSAKLDEPAEHIRELRKEVITLRDGLKYLNRNAKLDVPKFAINSLTGEKVTLVPHEGSQSIFILPSFIGHLDHIGPSIKYMCVERVHVYTVAKIFYPSVGMTTRCDNSAEQNIQLNKDTRATIKKTFMDQYCDQVFPLSKFKYLADNAVRHTKEDLTLIHGNENYYEVETFIVKLSNRNGDYASLCNPNYPPGDTKFGQPYGYNGYLLRQVYQPILVEFFL